MNNYTIVVVNYVCTYINQEVLTAPNIRWTLLTLSSPAEPDSSPSSKSSIMIQVTIIILYSKINQKLHKKKNNEKTFWQEYYVVVFFFSEWGLAGVTTVSNTKPVQLFYLHIHFIHTVLPGPLTRNCAHSALAVRPIGSTRPMWPCHHQ